jgi:hypothetical protein
VEIPDHWYGLLRPRSERPRRTPQPRNELGAVAGRELPTLSEMLRRIVDYWRDKYDWRAQEKRFNQFDQFKTTIDGDTAGRQ